MSGMWGRNPETILVAERQEVGDGRHFGLGRRDMIRQLWTSRMITALAHLSVFEVLVVGEDIGIRREEIACTFGR